eukprot:7503557-Pyramimonas_sp.AAC.1
MHLVRESRQGQSGRFGPPRGPPGLPGGLLGELAFSGVPVGKPMRIALNQAGAPCVTSQREGALKRRGLFGAVLGPCTAVFKTSGGPLGPPGGDGAAETQCADI